MINHLRIQNFKGWQDSGPIRLAPLTLLFGANSAGKTSIPHLLLMLRQTIESPDRKRVLHLGDASSLVDLGTYEDIVFQHDLERSLSFELGWNSPTPVKVEDPLSSFTLSGSRLRFRVDFRTDRYRQPAVQEMSYALHGDDDRDLVMGMRRRQTAGSQYDLFTEGFREVRQTGRAWPLPPPFHFHGFPDEAIAYYQNTAFLSDVTLRLQELMKSIYHVGPLRQYPDRTYLWSGEQHQHVGQRGERAVEAILAAKDRRFNWQPRERLRSLEELVAHRLKAMGLIHSFEVKPIAEGRKEHEVLLQTHPKMPRVNLTDVGFGVSQVLPVIVECLATPQGSIVILEQPEIHLHPKVQSDLADVFVDAIHARENGHDRQIQFIIESHSEHFLRRLQRRIAEEKLSPDDAALYFVHTDRAESRISELEVDLFGNITNWPDHFFGDDMADLVARSEAQARRMKEGEGG
jgi:predicted ATPase